MENFKITDLSPKELETLFSSLEPLIDRHIRANLSMDIESNTSWGYTKLRIEMFFKDKRIENRSTSFYTGFE